MRVPASVLVLLPLLLLPGCDAIRETLAGALAGAAGGSEASAEAPAGWESVEAAEAAKRLYYQFIDERGQVRFVERIEEVPEPLRGNVGFVKLDVPPPLSPADALQARNSQIARGVGVRRVSTGAAAAPGGQPRIIVYYADWCGACRKAKRYLNEKGVRFEIRNVDNPAVAAELRSKTGARSIPVIDVDGRILTGFSPRALDQLIDRA